VSIKAAIVSNPITNIFASTFLRTFYRLSRQTFRPKRSFVKSIPGQEGLGEHVQLAVDLGHHESEAGHENGRKAEERILFYTGRVVQLKKEKHCGKKSFKK
jgi:hypothetical protein